MLTQELVREEPPMTNPVDTIIVSTLARIDPETQPAHGDELVEAHSRPLRRAVHRGMVTAEYAVGILAAVAFALVLYSVVTDDQTKNALLRVVIDWMGQLSAFLPK